jgi:hypothetical protein
MTARRRASSPVTRSSANQPSPRHQHYVELPAKRLVLSDRQLQLRRARVPLRASSVPLRPQLRLSSLPHKKTLLRRRAPTAQRLQSRSLQNRCSLSLQLHYCIKNV